MVKTGTQCAAVEGIPMNDKRVSDRDKVLIILETVENLPLPEAIHALDCILKLLNAAQVAAESGEELGRLVKLKDLEDTPRLEQVLTVLLDAEPDCRAAADIAAAALKIKLKQSVPPK